MQRTPGPPGRFGVRNVLRFARDPLAMLRHMTDRYGDVVEMQVMGKPWVLFNHPRDIEEGLVKNASVMGRDEYVSILETTLGHGLLTSDGALWKRQRRLMSQAFTPKRIRSYAETMARVTAEGLPWQKGEVINLHDEMSRVTMEVVASVLFGHEVDASQVETVRGAMEIINEYYANSPEAVLKLPAWTPTPRLRNLKRSIAAIDEVVFDIIRERRRGEVRDDLLGTLLAAVDDDGKTGMDDQQLRDEAITLFLAGHETTALALAHTFFLLARYPEVEQRVLAEVNEVVGDRLPTAEDAKALRYTEQVIKEAMRLYPPAWLVGREATEDVTIAGHLVPKGAQLMMSPWIVHRDPRFFKDPEAFDPDRFSKERSKGRPRFAYFPFGGGPRTCIGSHFAMMEAILMLAVIVQRFHLELLPEQTLELKPSVTLRPKGEGLSVRVHKRAVVRDSVQPEQVASP